MEKLKRTFGFIFNHSLGKRHPARALFNFFYWQLQSNLAPSKLIIKSFIHPVKFYSRKGLTGITGNIYTGLHEFDDMGFLLHFLRPGDIFFDIGANVGSYTLLASGVCGAKTIAIEPSKTTFSLLQQNTALNGLQKKVTLVNAGAGAEPGSLSFSKNNDTTNRILATGELQGNDFEQVDIITIDSLSAMDSPALIKIDVEGFETAVLNGMANTLKHHSLKAIIIELNGAGWHYGYNEQDIHQLLLSHGFKPYAYDPLKRALELLPLYGTYNTIYCRDSSFIMDRLKTAKAFNVMGETI